MLALAGCGRGSARMKEIPDRVLWAWESPQDLRFLRHREGVAFLGGELHLEGTTQRWVPRRNPLYVNAGTPLLAVLRIESRDATLSSEQGDAFVSRALGLLSLPGVKGLQIDFDAKVSERNFYAVNLTRLRARMPQEVSLSITALASWCLDDRWLSGQGLDRVIDEAVPMLFRMGGEDVSIRARFARGEPLGEPLARSSCGLSTDEPLPPLRGVRRYYVFHPGSWTADAWDRISRELP